MTLITKFVAPASEVADLGLKEIQMSRLGRFVALAGKNGAGKSRILTKLESYVRARFDGFDRVSNNRRDIAAYEQAIQRTPPDPALSHLKSLAEMANKQLDLTLGRVFSDESSGKFKAIRFVPKQLILQDPRQHASRELITRFAQAKIPGLNGSESNCLFYVRQLQERWWNASHQGFPGPQEVKLAAVAEYESFQETVQRLLREHLARNVDGEPTLFGKPISDTGLSDGQKVILQLCVALHAQRGEFDNTVFILDEPENHLHPSAAIELLESLYQGTEQSQIWIATHSIPLLAYVASVEPMALWYVEDGVVANSGRYPKKVLDSLLGTDERIGQLNAFTGLPAQLAAITYASESLLPPRVVISGDGDPQVTQVQEIITRLGNGSPLSVMDFGAGKGRLLDGLGCGLSDMGKSLSSQLEYFAFDQFLVDKNICQGVIHAHFPGGGPRYFSSREEFFSHKEDGSIAVVVMCNVLHEISPREWLNLFSDQSLIHRALRENGYLLVVEDQRIPVGEHAHEYGFIVLDTSHLRTLFAVKEEDVVAGSFVCDDKRSDGRLKAHLVAKSLLLRITTETRKKAIEQLKETAKENIKQLRTQAPTYANGQLHGFWIQQFANASLFLSDT